MGFFYEDIEDMKVVVFEVCNNFVLYVYLYEGGMVEVVFEVDNEILVIIVKDEGVSFENVNLVVLCVGFYDMELIDV